MKKMNKKAFTLIELLIVIAIIGILFIVLVSKVDFATDKAKATGVQTDFRSFQVAFETVAKENAGFNTFGWDEGDENGDRVRNSYDVGDTNKDGVMDDGETWTGRKKYTEDWTGVYTLINPADATDKSAIFALETAINKNLDPKLHITIADDYSITMANQAQDPWKTEYVGKYITNASVDSSTNSTIAKNTSSEKEDSLDRGAIIIYSKGANQELGCVEEVVDGEVVVTVLTKEAAATAKNVTDHNVAGKDDYSIATIYTYKNGYGEVITATTGFSNNQ